MTSPSNLYAEKIFSEHPIALWALDDKLDFISLIDEDDKSLTISSEYWSITGGSVSNVIPTGITPPILDSPFSLISTDINSTSVELTSRQVINSSTLNQSAGSFNFSTYLYSNTGLISSVLIGYTDGENTVLEPFQITVDSSWVFLSKTFDLPVDSNIQLLIKINYSQLEGESDYNFYLNGISLGQESEQHNLESDGIYTDLIPESIAIQQMSGVQASAYGLQVANGYYLANGNYMCARNYGIPMVYGTSNVTKLFPNQNNLPSMIIPAFGFLNQAGKNKEYTFEAWLKVKSNLLSTKRIIGPISSDDGLYVDGSFLTLKIGESTSSYSVKQWDRPMLVNIVYTDTTSSLFVNGEQVFEMATNTTSFPDRLDVDGKDQDWIGFYAYEEVPVIEVDCVAIYSYAVPEIVAKRRFIYGQGVDFPENLNTGYNGTSVYVDYKFSNYSNNYIYPDIGRWKQGFAENIAIVNNSLETPVYAPPSIFIDNKYAEVTSISVDELVPSLLFCESLNSFERTDIVNISGFLPDEYNIQSARVINPSPTGFYIAKPNSFEGQEITQFGSASALVKQSELQLLSDIEEAQDEINPYINLSPNSKWNNTNSYLFFNSLNLLKDDVEAFYCIFKATELVDEKQILFVISDESSKNYFEVSIVDQDTIQYAIKYGESELNVIYSEPGYVLGSILQVGIDLSKISNYYGKGVRSLFGNKDILRVYVAGHLNVSNKFRGNIYKVGVSTKRNAAKISNFFREDGILINQSDPFSQYFEADGTTQIPFDYSGGVPSTWLTATNDQLGVLDGGLYDTYGYPRVYSHVASYTLFPTNYLGKFVLDVVTDSYWQDYLPLKYFSKYVEDGADNKSYAVDYIQFNVDYPSMAIFDDGSYDTRLSNTRTYVSFKYISDRGSSDLESLTFFEPVPSSNVIIPTESWQRTAYEVITDTVIYPPQNIDFKKLVMVVHIDIKSSSTSTRKIRIKGMSLAGNALNKTTPTQIGTRFGTSIVPSTKVGIYSDYRSKNPIIISKQSSPYLSLTPSSGIGLLPFESNSIKSLKITINPGNQELYRIGAMQTAFRYRAPSFPQVPEQVFEIVTNSETVKVFVVAANSSGTRGLLYAIDNETKLRYSNLNFFINGSPVKYAYINASEWLMLGMQFPVALDFDSNQYDGLSITGRSFINNLSFYQISAVQNSSTFIFRSWGKVASMLQKEDNIETPEIDESQLPTYWSDFFLNETWGDITGPVSWGTVLFVPSQLQTFLDPKKIYSYYLGTNKSIVGNEKVLAFNNYEYRFYKDAEWQSSIATPV